MVLFLQDGQVIQDMLFFRCFTFNSTNGQLYCEVSISLIYVWFNFSSWFIKFISSLFFFKKLYGNCTIFSTIFNLWLFQQQLKQIDHLLNLPEAEGELVAGFIMLNIQQLGLLYFLLQNMQIQFSSNYACNFIFGRLAFFFLLFLQKFLFYFCRKNINSFIFFNLDSFLAILPRYRYVFYQLMALGWKAFLFFLLHQLIQFLFQDYFLLFLIGYLLHLHEKKETK